MPTYEYACTVCAERTEAVQSFTDPPLTACPACGGKLRKVFSPVGVVFKGSGFYKNDSRGKPAPSSASPSSSPSSDSKSDAGSSSSGSGSSGSSGSGSSGSSGSSDAGPAPAAKPATPSSTGSGTAATG